MTVSIKFPAVLAEQTNAKFAEAAVVLVVIDLEL